MVAYKFVYFDAQARGEPMRLAFAKAGVQFTDHRVKYENWEKEQSSAPQKRLPYLEIDGSIKVSQSLAILRYLGREFGLAGKTSIETLFVDELIDTCADLQSDWEKSLTPGTEAQMAEAKAKFQKDSVTKYFQMLETLVKDHGKNGFAVGDNMTIADLMLYNTVQQGGTETLGNYPCLKANRAKVEADGNIAKWLSARPKKMY